MVTGPTGMVFSIDPARGVPIPQNFQDYGTLSETPFTGDWQLVVTGVPPGTTPATVAALITSAPVALPLPFASFHWKVAYAALGSAITATPW